MKPGQLWLWAGALVLVGCSGSAAPTREPPRTALDSASLLSTDLVSLTTGGRWTDGTQEGFYRVVVRNLESEHVISTLRVDWLAISAPYWAAPRVVAALTLPISGLSLTEPQFLERRQTWVLRVHTIDTRLEHPSESEVSFALGPPGQATVIQAGSSAP